MFCLVLDTFRKMSNGLSKNTQVNNSVREDKKEDVGEIRGEKATILT